MRTLLLVATLACCPALGAQAVEYRAPSGTVYHALPDTGAVAHAQAALDADPHNVDLILALGLAQAGIQAYREAITTFSRGIAIAPGDAMLYRWRGHRHLSVREFSAARADLEHGLTLDSLCYGCLYHLGIVQYVAGEFDAAARAFRRALPLAPDAGEFSGCVDWLWMSLSRGGHPSEARAVLDRWADSVTATNAYARRIALYRGRIGPDQVVTPADTGAIDVATLSYGLGNWYLVRGDTASARRWFTRSVRSGGWPAFGFIASEAELDRLSPHQGMARDTFSRADTLRGSFTTPGRVWWDVTFYDLHVRVSPADSSLSGWNAITYRVLEPGRLLQVDLMTPLVMDSITQNGQALRVTQEGNAWFVHFDEARPAGALETVTAWTTKSTSPRRPKPPPRNMLCTRTLWCGRPAVFAAAARVRPGAWVETQTSQLLAFTSAVQFMGSMQAWARYGTS